MTNNLQQINDVFYINHRIKEINPNYELYYNLQLKRYEVHDSSNKVETLCLTQKEYPDARLLDRLNKTKRENISKAIREVEDFNTALHLRQENQILDKASEQIKEIMHFIELKPSSVLSCEQIRNIIK